MSFDLNARANESTLRNRIHPQQEAYQEGKKGRTRKSGIYRITSCKKRGERGQIRKILQNEFAIRKYLQFRVASKPQFSSPVPERGIIDPEKLRRLGFIPPRREKGFPEKMPVHRFMRHAEIDALGGKHGVEYLLDGG